MDDAEASIATKTTPETEGGVPLDSHYQSKGTTLVGTSTAGVLL